LNYKKKYIKILKEKISLHIIALNNIQRFWMRILLENIENIQNNLLIWQQFSDLHKPNQQQTSQQNDASK
jgi:hypothetical protein